jgi:tetratricopeptide (TPR) repeat protein
MKNCNMVYHLTVVLISMLFTVRADSDLSPGKLRSLGEQAMSEHRYDEAITFYSQVIDIEPENGSNYYKLFRVHSRMKNLMAALKDISKAVEIDPQAEYHYQKGKLLVALGQCEDAILEYQKADLNAGTEAFAHKEDLTYSILEAKSCAENLSLATQAFNKKQFKEANHYFNMVLSHVEQAPDILFLKAQAEYELDDYYGVVSDTGKILKVHGQNIEAYLLRAQAYFRLGDHDISIQHLREGLKLDPEHTGSKKLHKLIKSIQKKEKKGDDAYRAGKLHEAIENWWAAIKIDSTHRAFARPTMLKISKAHNEVGEHDTAIKIAKDHVEENETLEGLFALGDALLDGEKFQEAVNTYQRSMEFEVSIEL